MSTIAFRDPTYPILTRAEWAQRINCPPTYPGDPNARLTRIYDTGYSVVTAELLDRLVEFIGQDTVLEVGAGSGYLARLLSDRGVKITAIDSQEGPNTREPWWQQPLYYPVEKKDVRQLQSFDEGIILLAWPCMNSDFSVHVLRKMVKGQILIYNGESDGGCTATPEFFAELHGGDFVPLYVDDIDDAGISEHLQCDYWSAFIKQR